MGGGFSAPDPNAPKKSFNERMKEFNEGAAGVHTAVKTVSGITNDSFKYVRDTGSNIENTATSLKNNYMGLRSLAPSNVVADETVGETEGAYEGFFEGGDTSFEKKPLDSILAYRKSKSHESKKALAEKVIEALKIAGVNVREGGDIADIARAIMEKLPNPHKDQSYKIESESQKNVLKALVKGLNDAFTPGASEEHKLIRPTTELNEIARQAIEFVYSMTTGVHDEFLTVQASVVNALHNVKILRKLMDTAHDEVVSQANGLLANPERDNSNYETYQEIYKRIAKECDRQIEMLSNMLDATMGPETNVLQQLADETSADYKYIRKYVVGNNMDLKTSAFVMAHLVHGIAATAVMLTTADKVFGKLGEQMNHLKGATEEVVDKAFDELIIKNPSEAAKYIKWKTTVKMYNAELKVREETMKKHHSLGSDNINGSRRAITGNAELFQERRNKYDVALNKKTKERQIIFSDFIVKTAKEYAKLLAAIDVFGPKLGSEVPISDKLLDLREAFSRLVSADMKFGQGKLERALIGFNPESDDRQLRDAFMNNIRLVKTVVEHVMNMELYSSSRQYFEPVLAVITKIIEHIDFYYDVIKQKYGNAESGVSGGDDDDISLEDYELPEVSRASHDLRKSVNSFIYYYYVAKVKENLKQTHSEVASYGEEYESLLGEAVACRLKKLKTEYDDIDEQIERSFGPDNRLEACKNAKNPPDDATRGSPEVINYAYKINVEETYKMFKDLNKKEYECKQGFYKALQAVDLYLKEFTESATAHPEDIADIKKMLTGVDIIGPWYDDKTGDNIAHAFDMIINPLVGGRIGLHIWSKQFDELSAANNFIDNDNLITVELARKGVTVGSYKPSVIIDNDDLQTRVSRAARNNAIGATVRQDLNRPLPVNDKQKQSKHYYENLVVSSYNPGDPGRVGFAVRNFNISTCSGRNLAIRAKKHFSSAYDNFQALKNIINAVVRMGDKFGNKELRNSVFMSPSEIFKGLMGYLKCSTMSFFLDPVTKEELNGGKLADNNNDADGDNGGLKTGLSDDIPSAFVYVSKVGSNSNFKDEDNHFQMIVKAMAAKILTVIGMYELFNRPGPIYDITPTRMIIGGGSSRPEINPDASELYFRLVRLAEYYRSDILNFKTATTGSQISLIPDMNGVFAGFIRLMWMRFGETTVYSGTYSESELQLIIAECNRIYQHFKNESGEHSVASKACSEFVMEINRRYGVVKREDFEKFYKMMRLTGELGNDRIEYNNYAILPGEGELRAKRPAPSDQYVILGKDATKLDMKCKTELDLYSNTVYRDMIRKFRNNLNTSFRNARGTDLNNFVNISYSERIKQAAAKMRSSNESEKYDVVSHLIRGSQAIADTDVTRDYFFHETVVTGINTLCAITKMLTHIREQVKIMRESAERTAGAGVVDQTGAFTGNILGLNAGVARAISDVDKQNMLTSIIILVNGLNSAFDGKVKVRFPQSTKSQLLVDFSDLSNSLEDLMDSVKYFINLMRQHMSNEVIKKYEGTSSTDEGTIKWLEANLFEKLLKGKINKYATNSINQDQDTENDTLESLTKNIDNLYSRLAGKYNGMQISIQNLVWHSEPIGGVVALSDDGIFFLLGDKTPFRPPANANPAPNRTKFTDRVDVWDGRTINTAMRGMLPVFNQLLAMYLTQFYDTSVKKIYRGLIESFASGSFNQAITDPDNHTYKDLFGFGAPAYAAADFNTNVGALIIPINPPTNVLYTSLALILQRMMTDSTREGVSAHLISTLSEVPMYVRERMRANLPVFNKMFTLIQKQGEFIKQLLEQTEIVLGNAANRNADERNRTNMIACIDKIVEGCYTLATSASDVYRELADEPKYLQTQENSIRDYQARHGKMPLMPLSSSLFYLAGMVAARNDILTLQKLMPSNSVGSPEFKMMYGTRGLLNDKQWKPSSAPGVIAALEQFKQSSNVKVDDSKYEQLVSGIVDTVRGLVDARYYVAGMTLDRDNGVYGGLANISGINNRIFKTSNIILQAGNRRVYSLNDIQPSLPRVLAITEGSSQSQQLSAIVKVVSANTTGVGVNNTNPRTAERFYNIIDMNIIPINVHALMRTIPLAPLYNYTFTFEENARLALGLAIPPLNPITAREFFYKILEDPYYHVVDSGDAALSQLDQYTDTVKPLYQYVFETSADYINVELDIQIAYIDQVNEMCGDTINMLKSFQTRFNTTSLQSQFEVLNDNTETAVNKYIAIIQSLYQTILSMTNKDNAEDEFDSYIDSKLGEDLMSVLLIPSLTRILNGLPTPVDEGLLKTMLSHIIVKAIVKYDKNKYPEFNRIREHVQYYTRYISDPVVRVAGPAGFAVAARVANAIRSVGALLDNDAYINIRLLMQYLVLIIDSMNKTRHSLDRYSFQNEKRTLAALMHGDESLLMGRPKFISDQLFHKVLPTVDSDNNLTYYANGELYKINVGNNNRLKEVFVNRFNTRVVRNFMHCANVQRVLRLRLNQELTHYRDVLVDDTAITNAGVTEFGNLRFTDMRAGSTTNNRNMDPRYEDVNSRTYNSEDNIRVAR